jgi:hypothetical protein
MRWLLLVLLAGCGDDDPCQPEHRTFEECRSPGLHCTYPDNDCFCEPGKIWECRDGEGPPDLARAEPDLSGRD